MRFRFANPADIPDLARLYGLYLQGARLYPKPTEEPLKDFSTVMLFQMLNSPITFTIVAVAGGVKGDDGTIVGGRPKAMSVSYVSERPLGRPSPFGFCELLVVDPKFRGKKIGQKLALVTAREMVKRGAKVIECAYGPGSDAERIWLATGFEPYSIHASWTLEGEPRVGLPLIPSGVRVDATSAKSVPTEG